MYDKPCTLSTRIEPAPPIRLAKRRLDPSRTHGPVVRTFLPTVAPVVIRGSGPAVFAAGRDGEGRSECS